MNSTKTTHPPTPWRVESPDVDAPFIVDATGQVVELDPGCGDIQTLVRVVRAVNAHDELVAALTEARKQLLHATNGRIEVGTDALAKAEVR